MTKKKKVAKKMPKTPASRAPKKVSIQSSRLRPRYILIAALISGLLGVLTLRLTNAFTVLEDAPIRFTMGSTSLETADGNLWEASGYQADGTVQTVSKPIIGTTDQQLYQTQRTGISYLKVPNLPHGRYKVTLYFADTESVAKGQRSFAIYAEGQQEQDVLDIYRKTSSVVGKAYVYDFSTDVNDGELTLGFTPITGKPILSAFMLLPRKLDDAVPGNIPEPTPTPVPTPTPTPTPTPEPTPTPPVIPTPLPNGGRQVNVSTSAQLTGAIAAAQPGDVINLADGSYTGKLAVGKYTGSFAPTRSGTSAYPIVLKGSHNAVIDGDGQGGHYGLYLVGANYWRVEGVTVTNATKGIVLDGSSHNVFNNIVITKTGQEGIHFRTQSTDNTIMNSTVSYTGQKNATYGEGIYFGSANSNWGTYNGGQPDKSDRNQALNNTITHTGAESMDIKEGTTGGVIKGNTIDGTGMTGSWADSWLDVKGNNYTITDNTGSNALQDGFQVHVAISGWGQNNYFAGNTANVNGPGWGLSVQAGASSTVWKCSNVVRGAASGNAVINGKTPFACTQ